MEQRSAGHPQYLRTYTVDSYANGIAFGQHRADLRQDARDVYGLRLEEGGEVLKLRSRYSLHNKEPLFELERHLMLLSQQGVLGSSIIYLGTTTDPFHPFEGKFDASMKFLELFLRYTPGMLCVQTRSPLIVLALPVFKTLGKHVHVTIGVETPSESVVQRYTPGLPRVEERLRTAEALRRFGIPVSLQVSPVLPYGDWRNDAPAFAERLCEHADHLFVRGLSDGSPECERRLGTTTLAKKLAADRMFHWLRPDSATPLITAIEACAKEKLSAPVWRHLGSKQLAMFAA